jgi:NADPH-dependent curcumin reductase CurA
VDLRRRRAPSAACFRAGNLRYRETVVEGLEQAPAALAGLMRGDNTGKTLVRIDPPR